MLPETVVYQGRRSKSRDHGRDWYAIVTQGDEILIFERFSGKLHQRVLMISKTNCAWSRAFALTSHLHKSLKRSHLREIN